MSAGAAAEPPCAGACRQRAQATVELALCLPLVALLLLAVVQVGLVVRAEVLVTQAAREAARAAALDPAPSAAAEAARRSGAGLASERLRVEVAPRGAPGTLVEVVVRYRMATDVPLVGPLVGDVDLEARAAMRVEAAGAGGSGRQGAGRVAAQCPAPFRDACRSPPSR